MILRLSLILLLSMSSASATAQTKAPAKLSTQAQKKMAAEQAADRVMRRFYETLDFKTIYDEMYVPDPFKSTEVRWNIRGIVWQSTSTSESQTLPKTISIDFPAMERAYIALQNFEFLMSAVKFTYNDDEDKLKAEVEDAYHQFYEPMTKDRIKPILTSERLDAALTVNLNRFNDFLRKHVVAKDFDSPIYKARVASIDESRADESSRLKELFELKRNQPIFVVRRENHYLYFIEANGELRMLSSTPRIMD